MSLRPSDQQFFLERLFHFTESDLEANRRGLLSERQRIFWKTEWHYPLRAIGLWVVIIVGAFVLLLTGDLLCIGGVLVVGLTFLSLSQFRWVLRLWRFTLQNIDLWSGKVRSVSGRVNASPYYGAPLYGNQGDGEKAWHVLGLRGENMLLTLPQYRQMYEFILQNPKTNLTFYFMPYSKVIVGVEMA